MFKLFLKTLGVILATLIGFPLAIILISALPAYIGHMLPPVIGFGVACIVLIAEIVGLLYFIENLKGVKDVK